MWRDGSTSACGGSHPSSPANTSWWSTRRCRRRRLQWKPPGWWQRVAQIEEGVIDSASGTVGNLGVRFLIYLKDGRVHRLDLRRGNWPPVSVETSSLPTTQMCHDYAKYDPGPSISGRTVTAAVHDRGHGPESASTSDDRHVAVRLDMTSADAPVAVTGEVTRCTARHGRRDHRASSLRDGNRIQRVDSPVLPIRSSSSRSPRLTSSSCARAGP